MLISLQYQDNVGTPQEVSLSLVLFIIYIDYAVKKVRPTLLRPTIPFDTEIPNEGAHTDSFDFIGQNHAGVNKIQENTKKQKKKKKKKPHRYK